MLKTIKWQR